MGSHGAMQTNPDRVLIRRFLDSPGSPIAFDGSPLAAALGGQVRGADPAEGRLTLGFHPGAGFVQGGAVLQGGAVAAMLDFAIAGAAFLRLRAEDGLGTVTLSISFMAPASPGGYVAEGLVERVGRRMVFARGFLCGVEGNRLVASATAAMAVLPPADS